MPQKPKFHFDNIFMEKPPATGPYRLWQVGDFATDGAFVCGKHQQKMLEVSYCVSGNCTFFADEKRFSLTAGDLIITRPGCIHDICCSDPEGFRYYYLAFSFTDTSQPVEQELRAFFRNPPETPVAADKSVPNAFQDIFRNILNQDCFSAKLTEDALRRVLVWTLRSFRKDSCQIYLPENGMDKNPLLSQICAYLDESVEDISALKTLPDRFGYSYSYLSSLFSKAIGMSLKRYFQIQRHGRACELLEQGHSVTQVASILGYASVHVFSHAFSELEGMPPSSYKKRINEKGDNL